MSTQQGTLADRIAALITGVHDAALLISGAPGSGKSHLLRELAAEAGMPAPTVRGNPIESALPLSGLGTVLAAVDPRAADFAGRFALRSTEPLALHAAASDILALLRGMRLPPTAVLVDDIDLMDAVSRALLGFMAGRLGGTGMRLVVTATRVGGRDPLAAFPRARLGPLSPELGLELAMAAGGSDLHEGTARILVAQSAGNPATLLSRVRSLSAAQRAGLVSLPFPLPVRRAGRRIARHALSKGHEGSLDAIRAIAVAPLAHPAALVEAGVATRDGLAALVRAGIVDELEPFVRLRSPILRAAVLANLSAPRRAALHTSLAVASRPCSTELERWHAAAGDPAMRCSTRLIGDATALLEAGMTDAAVEVADAALGRRDDPPDAAAVLDLAERLLRRGDAALADRYLLLAAAGTLSPRERSAIVLARLQAEVERHGRVSAVTLLNALDRHGGADPAAAARLLATTALWDCLRGDPRTARELLARVAVAGDPGREVAGLVDAVSDLADAGGGRLSGRTPEHPMDVAHASAPELLARARAASLREEYDSAARRYALALDVARDDAGWRDLALLLTADNLVRAGRVDEARSAVARLREVPQTERLAPLRVLLEAWGEVAAGRVEEAERSLRTWLTTSHPSEGLTRAGAHTMLGLLALGRGEGAVAVRELSHADLLAGDADPGIVRHHPLLIDALVRAGRPDAALAALDRFERGAGRFPGRWATLAIAGARAVVAHGDVSELLFDRALGAVAPGDPPLDRANLLLRKGRRLLADGAAGADAVLLQARAAFESAGAVAWYPVDDDRPEPAARRLVDLLSEPEREVARLVVLGLQNKEIAGQLFVSLRTVELRLTNIYRKTGTRSRSHLVAVLA